MRFLVVMFFLSVQTVQILPAPLMKKPKMGRPPKPAKDKLDICFRADFESATDKAMRAEMKASGQSRSQVMRRLIRDGLRACGHKIPKASDES